MPNTDSGYRFCPRCGGPLAWKVLKESEPQRLVCQACAFVFYLDPKVAACTICTVDGGIVLLKRSIEPRLGTWVFPGGFVDRGEPVAAAAVRETLEESNLRVTLTGILDVYSFPAHEVVVVVYAAEVVGGTLGAGDECSDARAFPPESIPWGELAFESTRAALRDYVHRFFPARSRAALNMDLPAEFDRARLLAGLGRVAEAVPLLDTILHADPAHRAALLLRATLHSEEREWEKALELNERVARLWPRSAEALNAFARCLHARGRDQEAMKVAHEALAVLGEGDNFAQTAAVYLTLVWCLREMRRYREAIAVAEEGLARMPDAVLAQWATQIEEELVEAEKERC